MDTLLNSAAAPAAAVRKLPMRWLHAALSAWQAARRRAADLRTLQAMGDAELRDLGIGRSEAGHFTQPGAKSRGPW